jgi:hypothetical protein
MDQETMLRYIVGIAIAYGIGKGIYQSIRSRSIDYSLWAIITLLGAVLWISRGFLNDYRMACSNWLFYHFTKITIWQVFEICCDRWTFGFPCDLYLLEYKGTVSRTNNLNNFPKGIFNKQNS